MNKPRSKRKKNQNITRPEFHRLQLGLLFVLVLLSFAPGELVFFIPISHMYFLVMSGLTAAAYAVVMIWFIRDAKDYLPKFYIAILLITLFGFLNSLTWFNFLFSQKYPASFSGIGTLADALYFTIGTISTAGTGNIYPLSQTAKLAVTCEIIVGFALIVLVLVKETIGLKAKKINLEE